MNQEDDDCVLCEEKLNKGEDNALFHCEKCREKKDRESQLFDLTGFNIKI